MYYVDNVNGSDSNDGLSVTTPFLTLSSAVAAPIIWQYPVHGFSLSISFMTKAPVINHRFTQLRK